MKSSSEDETIAHGKAFAGTLNPGDVVALSGDLGAGKTQFVKGIAEGVGSMDVVTSPTFTLIQEYEGGTMPVYHADLYRLKSMEEAEDIGLIEVMEADGVTVVEWADKFPELMPAYTRWLDFKILDDDSREIRARNE